MEPAQLIDDATRDATAAIAPNLRRLGVYGVNFEQLIREAVRASLVVARAAHTAELDAARRVDVEVHQLQRQRLLEQLTDARAALGPMRAAHAEMAEALDATRAERDRFEREAGRLAAVLDIIEKLPYEGPEPQARRLARQALTP